MWTFSYLCTFKKNYPDRNDQELKISVSQFINSAGEMASTIARAFDNLLSTLRVSFATVTTARTSFSWESCASISDTETLNLLRNFCFRLSEIFRLPLRELLP